MQKTHRRLQLWVQHPLPLQLVKPTMHFKGIVDGIMFPYESKGWKFADHLNYTLENYAVAGAAFICCDEQTKMEFASQGYSELIRS